MLTFDEAVEVVRKLQSIPAEGRSKFSHTHCLCIEIQSNKELFEFLIVQASRLAITLDLGYAVLILEIGIAIGMEMEKQQDAIG